ncbi:MAG: hypothetical protein J6W64_08840 [Bacilli bacterium]|nr:hypothetical protein [Bacilli bacterium]
MKKVVLSLLVIVGIVLLTGCGKVDFSKTSHIACSKTEQNSSDTTTTILNLAYDKNEKITDFEVIADVQYNKQMSEEAIKIVEKTLQLVGAIPGISFKSSVGSNGINYKFSGNIKMLKVVMKNVNKDYSEDKVTGDTKSEALSELTEDGYTCEDIKK